MGRYQVYCSCLLLAVIKGAWEGITGFFGGVWESVKGVFVDTPLAPVFEGIVSGVMAVVSPLSSFFSNIWGGISEKAGEIDWMDNRQIQRTQ